MTSCNPTTSRTNATATYLATSVPVLDSEPPSTVNPAPAVASQLNPAPNKTTVWEPADAEVGTVKLIDPAPLASVVPVLTVSPSNLTETSLLAGAPLMVALIVDPGLALVLSSEHVACAVVGGVVLHP